MTTHSVTQRSYQWGLLWKVIATFSGGTLLTVLILYLFTHRSTGDSYADSFQIISQVREEIIQKSIIIYGITSFFVLLLTGVITLLYSHKVAGPIFRLTQSMRQMAAGDLRKEVSLRQKDAIHLVAREVNNLLQFYGRIVNELRVMVAELSQKTDCPKDVERIAGEIKKILAPLDLK